ncbi:hypothetical protein [Bernardetia sp.]|uniref:hypothetical protein n=1 Tax=Bernardetia sp. TaxID=1937974 RepID=UPI0025B95768|nr:hypothetical protein [Bernardetia sp.]
MLKLIKTYFKYFLEIGFVFFELTQGQPQRAVLKIKVTGLTQHAALCEQRKNTVRWCFSVATPTTFMSFPVV